MCKLSDSFLVDRSIFKTDYNFYTPQSLLIANGLIRNFFMIYQEKIQPDL